MSETFNHSDFGAVCEHGSLARVCLTCELQASIAELEQMNAALRADNTRLQNDVVMPLRRALDAAQQRGERLRSELAEARASEARLLVAIQTALDFAGTVAGGASWWDDVWPEHQAAIDAAMQGKPT